MSLNRQQGPASALPSRGKRLFGQKRAVFFTLIAILIISVLLIAFTPRSYVTFKDKVPVTQSRVSSADGFLENLKTTYLPTALRTSSYYALIGLSEYTKQKGTLFADFDEFNKAFMEVMLNGTLFCELGGRDEHLPLEECLGTTETIIEGRNFTQRLLDIESASAEALTLQTRFHQSYSDFDVKLFQNEETGPFQVGVNLTVNFTVDAGLATWDDVETVGSIFRFEGIEDPLYSVRSQEMGLLYTNVFNETNLTSWNLTNTFLQIEWRFYRYEKTAPSFLTRFTNVDEGSECCGIESLVNPRVMDSAWLASIERPYVDWCFFGPGFGAGSSSRCPLDVVSGALWNVSCITSFLGLEKFYAFSLDTYHLDLYNVSSFGYGLSDPFASECPQLMQAVCGWDPAGGCI